MDRTSSYGMFWSSVHHAFRCNRCKEGGQRWETAALIMRDKVINIAISLACEYRLKDKPFNLAELEEKYRDVFKEYNKGVYSPGDLMSDEDILAVAKIMTSVLCSEDFIERMEYSRA